MNFSEVFGQIVESVTNAAPGVLGAVAILLVGWIVALVVRAAVRKGLGALRVDHRTAQGTGRDLGLESMVSGLVYYIVLLGALLAALNALDLQLVSEPIQALLADVMAFLPRLVGAAVLAVVAWVVASVARSVARRALAATSLDQRMEGSVGERSPSENLANVCYAIVVLAFLPAVLGALNMPGVLDPIEGTLAEVLAFVPNAVAAGLIALVGWFVARLLRDIVASLLSAAGADRIGARAGLGDSLELSAVGGLFVYVLTLLPVLVAALNALEIDAVAGPATHMLSTVLDVLPRVIAATLIIGISWVVARLVGELATSFLSGIGADEWPHRMGIASQPTVELSRFTGRGIMAVFMLLAISEAANRLQLHQLEELVATFMSFAGQVLLGTLIIAVGFVLANTVRRAVLRSSSGSMAAVANLSRAAVMILVCAMGLRAMGIADAIVNLAFGLTLGAVAVAAAVAFGIGGREAAREISLRWIQRSKASEAEG